MSDLRKTEKKSHPILGGGQFGVGFSIGMVATFVLLLFMGSLGLDFTRQELLSFTPAFAAVAIAGASAIVSLIALTEQKRMRQAGTDPLLIAHFGQREDARELVTFNLTNVGSGAAVNVKLNVTPPEDLEKLRSRNILRNIFIRHHPFRVIPQNQSVSFSLAMGWELMGENVLPPFGAQISYEDIEGGKYESSFLLDVREMELLGAEKSPTMRAVAALEKMAKTS